MGKCDEFDNFGFAWAQHVNLPAIILPPLLNSTVPSFTQLREYARWVQSWSSQALQQHYRVQLWIPIDFSSIPQMEAFTTIHRFTDYATNVGMMLQLPKITANSRPESPQHLARHLQLLHVALGQPIFAVSIECRQFLANKSGYPALSKWHQPLLTMILQRIGRSIRVLLHGPATHRDPRQMETEALNGNHLHHYWPYLDNFRNKPIIKQCLDTDVAKLEMDYLDQLQRPLQPLRDSLENGTYETFEKDPVKYTRYQEAMALAFGECQQAQLVVLIVGAGRGPLLQTALKAYESLPQERRKPFTIAAVENNPSAVIYLNSKALSDARWQKHKVLATIHDSWRTSRYSRS